ncbi:MAG: transcriptional repressor [Planctomycetota bacterium]|nr:transcriptional repressor [Planctomycetota bacterium]
MDPKNRKQRLEHLTAGYSQAGLPLTTQRRALLEVLAGRTDHPTVDQIFEELSVILPEVSRTTVYRSLDVLANLGLLNKVEHPGSSVRFDPNTEPHHHFLCSTCGGLVDLPTESLAGSNNIAFVGEGFGEVEEISVLVRGRCSTCAAKA